MTGAPSKKPWWVRALGGRGRWYTLLLAVFLTISASSGLLTALAHDNLWWAALSAVGVFLAVWMWAPWCGSCGIATMASRRMVETCRESARRSETGLLHLG